MLDNPNIKACTQSKITPPLFAFRRSWNNNKNVMSSLGVKLLSVGQNINQQAQRSNCTGTKNDSHASYYGHMLDCYMVDMSFQNLFSLAVHTLKKKCSLVKILNHGLNSNGMNEFCAWWTLISWFVVSGICMHCICWLH